MYIYIYMHIDIDIYLTPAYEIAISLVTKIFMILVVVNV